MAKLKITPETGQEQQVRTIHCRNTLPISLTDLTSLRQQYKHDLPVVSLDVCYF